MNETERDRSVDTLMSIFDLKIHRALQLEKGVSARVFYWYDKKNNIRRFRVLDRKLSEEMQSRIMAWLTENVSEHDVIARLVANEMDADRMPPRREST